MDVSTFLEQTLGEAGATIAAEVLDRLETPLSAHDEYTIAVGIARAIEHSSRLSFKALESEIVLRGYRFKLNSSSSPVEWDDEADGEG